MAATPVKVTAPQSPEVEEQVEDLPEDEVIDDLDLGLGLEEALQGTFTSQPVVVVEEKHDESEGVYVCACVHARVCLSPVKINTAVQATTVLEKAPTTDKDSQHIKDQTGKRLQNTGLKEAIESLDEVTKVSPEECMDTNDTSGVSVDDIKPMLPEELEKIATCLVELKAAIEVASSTIVSMNCI